MQYIIHFVYCNHLINMKKENIMNIFEQASRLKLRFEHARGNFTVEQLWDLPLKSNLKANLNEIAVEVNKSVQNEQTIDFVDGGNSSAGLENQLRLDILKYIIESKKKDITNKQEKEAKLSQLRLLKEEQARRKLNNLTSGSDEELENQIKLLESK